MLNYQRMGLEKNQIAATIITYNEEENIISCLESIKWIKKIVIVDSFSNDQTINFARRYTKDIFYKKFNNNFSQQRNFALDKVPSRFDWILVLDADESLLPNSRLIIERLIKESDVDGYWIPRRNYVNKNTYFKYGFFYPDFQLRLFRNKPEIRYKGLIHEVPIIPKDKTREIRSFEIYHNDSHSKYISFLSFKRFFLYIEIEGKYIGLTNKSVPRLIFRGLFNIFGCFFQSFIRGRGFKDGFIGFRAAILFSLYRGLAYFCAIKYKNKKHNYAK